MLSFKHLIFLEFAFYTFQCCDLQTAISSYAVRHPGQ